MISACFLGAQMTKMHTGLKKCCNKGKNRWEGSGGNCQGMRNAFMEAILELRVEEVYLDIGKWTFQTEEIDIMG